jgi:hypothetical protein
MDRVLTMTPAKPKVPRWSDVKARLTALDAKALIALIKELHDADPAARRFLRARFASSNATAEEYRRRIVEAVYPDPLSRKRIRLKEAAAMITEYRRSTNDPVGTMDLMLSFVEAGTAQAADLGIGGMDYYSPLEHMLEQIVRGIHALSPADRVRPFERLIACRDLGERIGWGFGDSLQDAVAEVEELVG